MRGRDPHEPNRTATPLELLYDLVFVVSFGIAGNELAHSLAAGHVGTGLFAFSFVMFSVIWAWINFTWFASAFDTNDWIYRSLTFVQMVGVAILALGIPAAFESIDEGQHLGNEVMVVGYVVMRIALIAQWTRAYHQAPGLQGPIRKYIITLTVAQLCWIAFIFVDFSLTTAAIVGGLILLIELSGPVLAERTKSEHGQGTPWHAHHVAERYGLLAIITLGEGVVGTLGALGVLIGSQGWTTDAVLILIAGMGLTFGMWWTYFTVPSAEILHVHRERSFIWGYGHMVIYGSIAAVGAGLHVFAYFLDAEHAGFDVHIGPMGTLLTVAIPLAVFTVMLFALYAYMAHEFDSFHLTLGVLSAVVMAIGIIAVTSGLSPTWALLIVSLVPVVTIVGYETVGHRHRDLMLARLDGNPAD